MKALFLILLVLLLASCSKPYPVPQCDNITTVQERDICYNNLAIEEHSLKICSNIHDNDKEDWCKSIVERAIGKK